MPLTKKNIKDIKKQIIDYTSIFAKKNLSIKLNTSKLDLIFDKYIMIRDNIKNHMLEPDNGNTKRIDRIKVASIIAVSIVHIRPIEVKIGKTVSSKFEKYANIYLAYHTALAILQDFSHHDKIGEHIIDKKLYEIIRPNNYEERFRKLIVNNQQVIADINNNNNLQTLFFIVQIFYFIDFLSREKYQEKYIDLAS